MKTRRVYTNVAIITVAGLAVVVVGYLAYLSNKHYEKTFVLQPQQQLLMLAKSIAVGIEGFIREHSDDLKSISRNPMIQEKTYKSILFKEPPTGHCLFLDHYEAHKDHVDALTILDAKGIMLRRLPHLEERIGRDHTDKPGVAYVLREHKRHVSEVFYNNLGNLAISILEPVFYKNEFAGAVRWMIQINTISEHFVEKVKVGREGHIWMFDNREDILAHPRKEFVGMSVSDVIRKMHLERGETFDESGLKEHIQEEHDYLNRVKVEEEGFGIFVNRVTDKNELVAYKRIATGETSWNLIMTLPYSEIAGPIHEHARNTFGLAGIVVLSLGLAGMFLFRVQKRKAELETETKYLKRVAKSAEALKKSEEKLAGIVESVTDEMIMVDEQFNIVWANDIAKNLFRPDLVGKKCYEAYHGRDNVCEPCIVKQCFEDGKVHEFETEMRRAGGSQLSFWCTASVAARDEDGLPILVVEFLRDITGRKQTQKEIETLKQQMEFILGVTKTGIDIIDSDYNIRYIDTEWQKVYGDPTGRKCYEYFMGESEPCPDCGITKAMKTKAAVVTEEVLVKEGNRPIQVTTIPFQNDKGEWLFAEVNVDISERKRVEEEKERLGAQLRQAQKMEAIGTLAGGIAHDFNNILTPMIIHTEIAMSNLAEESPVRDNLQRVSQAAHRAKEMVRLILTFSRQASAKPLPMKVAPVVREVLKLLRASLPTTIEIRQDIKSTSDLTVADPTHIHQVLINLCTNAAHAMREKGGVLEVRLADIDLGAKDAVKYPDMNPGPYLRLTVSDTGTGMDRTVTDRIFDPFFTTKQRGEGTGMGLAVVHGIVKSCGGTITVDSEPEKGTTFYVFFPRTETEVPQQIQTAGPIPTGNERILFVEDDELVVDAVRPLFESLGYKVVARMNGLEALEVFRPQPEKFDLVITDQTMPHMPGKVLAQELIRIRPDIPIILCTGYIDQITEEETKAMGIREYVMKPFVMDDMARVIRKVLDE